MLNRYIFFILFAFNITSVRSDTYSELKTKHLTIHFHKDICGYDLDVNVIDEAYEYISEFIGFDENISKIYITPHNINEGMSPLDPTSKVEKSLVVVLNESKQYNFDIYDKESFNFIFSLGLSKVMIREKIKREMIDSFKYINYIYPIKNKISSILFQDWIIDGIAIYLAKNFSKNSEQNIRLIKDYSELAASDIDHSYIKGNGVRYAIEPTKVLTYLKSNDFYLKFLFSNFLDFISSKYGSDKVKESINAMILRVKGKEAWVNIPTDIFSKVLSVDNEELFNSWWNSISKRSGKEYSTILDKKRIHNIRSLDNKFVYLLSSKDGTSIKENIKREGRHAFGNDIEHIDIFNGDIFYSARTLSMSDDKFTYSIYRNGSKYLENGSSKFHISNEGIYLIENRGFRDVISFNGNIILPIDYGIKVESITSLDGVVYISGSNEKDELKIYSITNSEIRELDRGRSIFKYGDKIYYLKDDNNNESVVIELGKKAKEIYRGNKIYEATFKEDDLYGLKLNAKSHSIDKLEIVDGPVYSLTNRSIEKIGDIDSYKPVNISNKQFHIYPYVDIFGLEVGVETKVLKGTLSKVELLSIDVKWSLIESYMEKVFNPRFRTKSSIPFVLGRNKYIIPFIEFAASYSDGIDDNYARAGITLKYLTNNLTISPKIGIRAENSGKAGLSTILNMTNIYFHHYYGQVGEEVLLPEYRWYKMFDVIKSDADKVKNGKRDATSFAILGIRMKEYLNVNLTISPYKLKVKDLGIGAFAYFAKDFVLEDNRLIGGPELWVDIEAYGALVKLQSLLVYELDLNKFHMKNNQMVHGKVSFKFGWLIRF